MMNLEHTITCEPNIAAEMLSPISVLHRANDSYIGFVRRSETDGQWQNLFSLRKSELQEELPGVAQWLTKDAYFTINGMYAPAPFRNKKTGLPDVWRKESCLRYLNACYADLDIGRNGGSAAQRLTWRDVVAALGTLMDDGKLPQSSIFARSGRGVYVFWMLHDEQKPELPPRCWPETLRQYKHINKSIVARLQCLAADVRAIDGARVLRVPSTQHSKSNVPALYQVQHDGQGHVFSYSLEELAEFFQVRSQDTRKICLSKGENSSDDTTEVAREISINRVEVYGQRAKQAGKYPARANGPRRRAAQRAQDLLTIERHHGGWKKGRRLFHLRLYAHFLRAAGHSREEVKKSLTIMAHNCRPPYPSDPNDTPVYRVVEAAFATPIRNYKTDNLLHWLGLTEELCRELNLKTILPEEMRECSKTMPSKREKQRTERRDFLRNYISEHGLLSCREMKNVLHKAGIVASHQTVCSDLKYFRQLSPNLSYS